MSASATAVRPRRLAAGSPLARVPAWTITAVLGLPCAIWAPPSADLAAASYRSYLFGRYGFTLWDNGWYGGHHLPAYSLFAPALGWLIGPRLLALLSMTLATALFTELVRPHFPPRAVRVASVWFALGSAIALLAFRVPFDLGLAIGMGCLLAAAHRRRALALALAVLCALASPVAGGFLALAALAWALALRPRAFAGCLALAALAPIALLALVFPEGGSQPFVASAFYPALAGVLVIAALIALQDGARARARPRPRQTARERTDRVLLLGTLLYALALSCSYVLSTPVGGNADRLGALIAGPLAACVLIDRPSDARGAPGRGRTPAWWGPRVLLVLAPFLLYWQANAPFADFASAASDPAVNASYYAPLLRELDALGIGYSRAPARIEVVPTADHWEARYVAAQVAIARGWERQLDNGRNAIFYAGPPLTPSRYRAWLSAQAVSFIALPDAPLDYSGKSEARLVRAGLPYLREVWRSAHWRLFAVSGAAPLAQPPAHLSALANDSFTVWAPRAGSYAVRVRFTPYWAIAGGSGCVRRSAGGFTEVQARGPGAVRVVIDFTLARVFAHGPRCR